MGTRLIGLTVKVLEDLWTVRREQAEREGVQGSAVNMRIVGAALLGKLLEETVRKQRGKVGFAVLRSLQRLLPCLSASLTLSKALSTVLRKHLSIGYREIQRLSRWHKADIRLKSALLRQMYSAWIQLQSAPIAQLESLKLALSRLLWTRLKPVITVTLSGMRTLKLAQLLSRKKEAAKAVTSKGKMPSNSPNSLDSRHIAIQLVYQFVETRIFKVLNRSKRRLLRWAFVELYLVPKYTDWVELGVKKMREIVVENEGKRVRRGWGKWIKTTQKEEIRANLLQYVLQRQAGIVANEEIREIHRNKKEIRRKAQGIVLIRHVFMEKMRVYFSFMCDFGVNSADFPLEKQGNSHITEYKQQYRYHSLALSLYITLRRHVHFLQFQCLNMLLSPLIPSPRASKFPLFVRLGTVEIKRKGMWMLRAKMRNSLYNCLELVMSLRGELRNSRKRHIGKAFWQWKEYAIIYGNPHYEKKYLQTASKSSLKRRYMPISHYTLQILIDTMAVSLYRRPFEWLITQTGSEQLEKAHRLRRLVSIVGKYYRLRIGEGWSSIGSTVSREGSTELKTLAMLRLGRVLLEAERLRAGGSFQLLKDVPTSRLFPALSRPQRLKDKSGKKAMKPALLSTLQLLPALRPTHFQSFALLSAFSLWKRCQTSLFPSNVFQGFQSLRNRRILSMLAKSGRLIRSMQRIAAEDWNVRSRTLAKVLVAKELSDLRNCLFAAFVHWRQVHLPNQVLNPLYRAIRGKIGRDDRSRIDLYWTLWRYPNIPQKRPLIERLRVPIRLSIEPVADPLSPADKALRTACKARASYLSLRLQALLAVLFSRSVASAVEREKQAVECWRYGKSLEIYKTQKALLPVQMTPKGKKRNLQGKISPETLERKRKLHTLGELVGRKLLTDQRAALYVAFLKWEQLTCGGSWAQLAVLRAALSAKAHRDGKYTGFSRWQGEIAKGNRAKLKRLAGILLVHQSTSTRLTLRFSLFHWISTYNSLSIPRAKRAFQGSLYRVEPISVLRNQARAVTLGKVLLGKELGTKLRTAWQIWRGEPAYTIPYESKDNASIKDSKLPLSRLYFAFMAWKQGQNSPNSNLLMRWKQLFPLITRKLGRIIVAKVLRDTIILLQRPFRLGTGQPESNNIGNLPVILRLKALSNIIIRKKLSKRPKKGLEEAILRWKWANSASFLSYSLSSGSVSPAHQSQLSITRLTGLQILSPRPDFTQRLDKLRALSRVTITKRLKEIHLSVDRGLNIWKEVAGKHRKAGDSPASGRLRALAKVVVGKQISDQSPREYLSLQKWRDWAGKTDFVPKNPDLKPNEENRLRGEYDKQTPISTFSLSESIDEQGKSLLVLDQMATKSLSSTNYSDFPRSAAEKPLTYDQNSLDSEGKRIQIRQRNVQTGSPVIETRLSGLERNRALYPAFLTLSRVAGSRLRSVLLLFNPGLPTTFVGESGNPIDRKERFGVELPTVSRPNRLEVITQVLHKYPPFSVSRAWALWTKLTGLSNLPYNPHFGLSKSPIQPLLRALVSATSRARGQTLRIAFWKWSAKSQSLYITDQDSHRRLQALALALRTQSTKEGRNNIQPLWKLWKMQGRNSPLESIAVQKSSKTPILLSEEEGKETVKLTDTLGEAEKHVNPALAPILQITNAYIRPIFMQLVGNSILLGQFPRSFPVLSKLPQIRQLKSALPTISPLSRSNRLEVLSQVLRKYPHFPLSQSWTLWSRLTYMPSNLKSRPSKRAIQTLLLAMVAAISRAHYQPLKTALWKWTGKPQYMGANRDSQGRRKLQSFALVLFTTSAKETRNNVQSLWKRWKKQSPTIQESGEKETPNKRNTALNTILHVAYMRILPMFTQLMNSTLRARQLPCSSPSSLQQDIPDSKEQSTIPSTKPNRLTALTQVLRKYPHFTVPRTWALWTHRAKVPNSLYFNFPERRQRALLLAMISATSRLQGQSLRTVYWKWSRHPLRIAGNTEGRRKLQALALVLLTRSAKEEGNRLLSIWKLLKTRRMSASLPSQQRDREELDLLAEKKTEQRGKGLNQSTALSTILLLANTRVFPILKELRSGTSLAGPTSPFRDQSKEGSLPTESRPNRLEVLSQVLKYPHFSVSRAWTLWTKLTGLSNLPYNPHFGLSKSPIQPLLRALVSATSRARDLTLPIAFWKWSANPQTLHMSPNIISQERRKLHTLALLLYTRYAKIGKNSLLSLWKRWSKPMIHTSVGKEAINKAKEALETEVFPIEETKFEPGRKEGKFTKRNTAFKAIFHVTNTSLRPIFLQIVGNAIRTGEFPPTLSIEEKKNGSNMQESDNLQVSLPIGSNLPAKLTAFSQILHKSPYFHLFPTWRLWKILANSSYSPAFGSRQALFLALTSVASRSNGQTLRAFLWKWAGKPQSSEINSELEGKLRALSLVLHTKAATERGNTLLSLWKRWQKPQEIGTVESPGIEKARKGTEVDVEERPETYQQGKRRNTAFTTILHVATGRVLPIFTQLMSTTYRARQLPRSLSSAVLGNNPASSQDLPTISYRLAALRQILYKSLHFHIFPIWRLWKQLTKVSILPYSPHFQPPHSSLKPLFLALISATTRARDQSLSTAFCKWTAKPLEMGPSLGRRKLQALARVLLTGGNSLLSLWKRWRNAHIRKALELPFSLTPRGIPTGLHSLSPSDVRQSRDFSNSQRGKIQSEVMETKPQTGPDFDRSQESTNIEFPKLLRAQVLAKALCSIQSCSNLAAWLRLSQLVSTPSLSPYDMPRRFSSKAGGKFTSTEGEMRDKLKTLARVILGKIWKDRRIAICLGFEQLSGRKYANYSQFNPISQRKYSKLIGILLSNQLRRTPVSLVDSWMKWKASSTLSSEKARLKGPKAPTNRTRLDILESPFTPTVTPSPREKQRKLPQTLTFPTQGYEGNPFSVEGTGPRLAATGDIRLRERLKRLAGAMALQLGQNYIQRLWTSLWKWKNPSKSLPPVADLPGFSHSPRQLAALARVLVGKKLKEDYPTLPEVWTIWSQQPEAISSPKSSSLSSVSLRNSSRGAKLRSSRSLAASSPRSPIVTQSEIREKVGGIITKQQEKAEKEAIRSRWKRWSGPLALPRSQIAHTEREIPIQELDKSERSRGIDEKFTRKKDQSEGIQTETEFSPDWETHINAPEAPRDPVNSVQPDRTKRLKALISVLIPREMQEESRQLQRGLIALAGRKGPFQLISTPGRLQKRKKLTALAKALVSKEQDLIKFRLKRAWLELAKSPQKGEKIQSMTKLILTQRLKEPILDPSFQLDWSQNVPTKAGNTAKGLSNRRAPALRNARIRADFPKDAEGDLKKDPVVSKGEVGEIVEEVKVGDIEGKVYSEDWGKDYSAPNSQRGSDLGDVSRPKQGKRLRTKVAPSSTHPRDALSLWEQQSAPTSPSHREQKTPTSAIYPAMIDESKQTEGKQFPSFRKLPQPAHSKAFSLQLSASSSTSKDLPLPSSLKISWDSPLTEAQFYDNPAFSQEEGPNWDYEKGSKEVSDKGEKEGNGLEEPIEDQEIVIVSPHIPVLPKRIQNRSQRGYLQSGKATTLPKPTSLPALATILQRKDSKMQQIALIHWRKVSEMPRIALRKVQTMSSAPRKYVHFRGEVTYLRGNLVNFAQKIDRLQKLIRRKDGKRLIRGFAIWQNSLRSRRVVTSPTSDIGDLRLKRVITYSGKQMASKTFNWQQAEQTSRLEIRPVSSLSKSFWRPVGREKRLEVLSPRSRTTLPSPSGQGSFALPLYSSPYLPESYATLQFLARS